MTLAFKAPQVADPLAQLNFEQLSELLSDPISNAVPGTWAGTVLTGSGLSPGLNAAVAGGGLIESSDVLAVGAGNGITVNADDVALASSSAGNGLTYTSGVLAVGAGHGIDVTADAVDVDETELTMPSCRANRTTAQSIGTGAETAITFPNEDWDSHSIHAASGSTFTVPSGWAGIYRIVGQVQFNGSAAGTVRDARIRVNGTFTNNNGFQRQSPSAFSANDMGVNVATVLSLAVSDTVEVAGFQNTGGNLDVESAFLCMDYVRAAP